MNLPTGNPCPRKPGPPQRKLISELNDQELALLKVFADEWENPEILFFNIFNHKKAAKMRVLFGY
jgi:hypothetical protein